MIIVPYKIVVTVGKEVLLTKFVPFLTFNKNNYWIQGSDFD